MTQKAKKEIRIIGIDDSPFSKAEKGNCLVVGAVYRGGSFPEGILSTLIKVDGNNSTKKISGMIKNSKFKKHLQCIFLDGIAVGGFNVIDAEKLSKETNIPVIVVMRKYPDYKKIYSALEKIAQEKKIKLIEKLQKPVKLNKVFVQLVNIGPEKAKRILEIACTRSNIPEPLRIAHLIAGGIVDGESRGRA